VTTGPLDPRIRLRLCDLVDRGVLAARLVGRGRPAYDGDEMLRLAAQAILIRLGEGVNRIDKVDPGFVARHPDLELRPLKDSRNVMAHGYDIVDDALVWAILATNLPGVVTKIQRFLATA
jgi:uncharacterized protein with HEPN domain